ncbi:right-handed parallel beta-helix repeat-containing protein [Pedobacter sp. MC2016-05]|uniref:T9SS type A sorting domain-containing protein n=1 Tax=Pedobacter sp. MC2016-05 TaxID=2994474 RepID=UPI002247FB0C|nr:right-handed parallel beta-helix repeat-containing protein [Pedobacter sp. MC2016-05]MCX2473284.1 right-handed parallel beta-helix repeat-containing protein [Pedobacter sp. MC2016-05]
MIQSLLDHFRNFHYRILPGIKIPITAFLIFFLNVCNASTYYFSSVSGNDSRSAADAQNPATPWKSIAKLNAFFPSLKAGDVISFKRNEVFQGSILLKTSGISFNAFGTGSNPTISAMTTITQWKSIGNGVYESISTLSAVSVNILLINNAVQELGRYPNSDAANKGYLKIKSKTDNSITDNELGAAVNWKGAEVVIRKMNWILDRHAITAHTGSTLVYDRASSPYTPNNNYGYFIQNDQRTLDRFGEWYYNPVNKKVYVYFGASIPSSYKVEVSTIDNIVTASTAEGSRSQILFENINFKGANANAFSLAAGTNFTIKNCRIDFSGNSAIDASDIKNLTIENCIITGSLNNAVDLTDRCTGAVIKGNKIDKTMPFSGMGKSGDHNGMAIYATANNTLIDHNSITNTGYVGIYFGGENTHVKNNFVDHFCSIKDDGGGIYTFTGVVNTNFTNRSIVNNIITNGIGVKEGTIAENGTVVGIYLDDNVTGVNVSNNTISTISDNGIFIHNARNNSITQNTVFNCGAAFGTGHDNLGYAIANISVSENIFFAKHTNQWASKLISKTNDISRIGSLDNNYYLRPFDDNKVIHTQQFIHSPSYLEMNLDVSNWATQFSQDKNSKKSPLTFPTFILNKAIGTNRFLNGKFTADIAGTMFYGDGSTSALLDNTNKLAAQGSLKLTSSARSYLLINVGAVDAAKHYVLRFKAAGSKDANIKAFLRQWNAPHATISTVSTVKLTGAVTAYECVFSFPTSEPNTCITIQSDNENLVYWLDDIEFSEADVTITNPDDFIRFEYNASDVAKVVKLDAAYIDARNVSYSGSISIKPYASVILMRTSAKTTPAAPAVKANDQTDLLISTHSQYQSEIMVSENGAAFKAYTDTIKVGNVARNAGYWKFKIKSATTRNESAVASSPAFTVKTIPKAPVLTADDNSNTLTATHDLLSSEIVWSVNNGSFQSYTGTIAVGNVTRAAGYWKFKIRSATNRSESSVINSPAFVAVITPSSPVLMKNDATSTLSATHGTYPADIMMSVNNGAFKPYTAIVNVGTVARPVGYWKFKLRAGSNRSESAVVPSPAFSAKLTSSAPVLSADDHANTLIAAHSQYSSEIVFSVNNGSFQSYTGKISVGNVARAAGYWKFKIKAASNRIESPVINSPAFSIAPTAKPPLISADDTANTLMANHDQYASDIVFSVDNGSFQSYTGKINVGNIARAAGYWKFKVKASGNRGESSVVNSPIFNSSVTVAAAVSAKSDGAKAMAANHVANPADIVGNVNERAVAFSPAAIVRKEILPPKIVVDDLANTLSAEHDQFPFDILYSENNGPFKPYQSPIMVGDIARPSGYWRFKIVSGIEQIESTVISSAPFKSSSLPAVTGLVLYPNPVRTLLSVKHPEVNNNGSIDIFSVNGQRVKKINVARGSNSSEIDLSSLPAGTFVLFFNDGATKLTQKLIKID